MLILSCWSLRWSLVLYPIYATSRTSLYNTTGAKEGCVVMHAFGLSVSAIFETIHGTSLQHTHSTTSLMIPQFVHLHLQFRWISKKQILNVMCIYTSVLMSVCFLPMKWDKSMYTHCTLTDVHRTRCDGQETKPSPSALICNIAHRKMNADLICFSKFMKKLNNIKLILKISLKYEDWISVA